MYTHAHPVARTLMDEEFYYSLVEESGPFGSDDASDTFAGFCQWRPNNRETSPLEYLRQQFKEWEYPPLDWYLHDEKMIEQYALQNELGLTFLIGMDAAIISLAFSQLYLEGTVTTESRQLAKTAIDRQLHPQLMELWDPAYQPVRQEQLMKMLGVMNRV